MILQDKVAIVTGAGQGIGRGIAIAMAKEGCQVAVSDVNYDNCFKVVAEIEALGGKAVAIKCDVSQKNDVDNLIAGAVEKFGHLDIMVNNAGIYPFVPFTSMTEEDWDKVININLKSIFLCCQTAVKQMLSGGKIVNISSIAGFIGASGLTHYSASKGGVNGMIRSLAIELAARKININNVAPGVIETPGATSVQNEEMEKRVIANIPWGRMGQPEDIANAVIFLASDKADYITGQTLVVDGGYILR